MTEDLEEFERLLKASSPVEPEERVKKEAVFNAMKAFDAKISHTRQGIPLGARLMDAVHDFHNTIMRRDFMKKATVALSIGAVTLILLNTSQLAGLLSMPQEGAQKPVMHHKERVEAAADKGGVNDVSITPGSLPSPPSEMTAQPKPAMLTAPASAAREENTKLYSGLRADKTLADGSALQQNGNFEKKESYLDQLKSPSDAAAVTGNLGGGAAGGINSPLAQNSAGKDTESQALSVEVLPVARPENAHGKFTAGNESSFTINGTPFQQPDSYHDEGRDRFEHYTPNPDKEVRQEPVSTFSADVDTSSYSFMRATLNHGALPPADAVRTEELINYFPYDYAAPESLEEPFKANVAVFPTPWNKDTKLMRIGIKGYDVPAKEKPHSNLVFLLDTSGSMNDPVRLPLIVNSLKLLLDSLKPDDTVSIVTYAGEAGVALEPTQVKDREKIVSVLDRLYAMGSTAGFDGLNTAYKLAERNYDPHSVNRVILSTDGDFNVGITDQGQLKAFIEHERDKGIFLSILGVGMGNYNNAMMEMLAHNGNGVAAYIDNLTEARKVLVEEAGSTLFTIAKDVKIQVEFNPARVAEYRLIGYERRMLNREDFNNDKVDAGDIGSGHTVTALYEITPVGSKARHMDALRYQKTPPEEEQKDPGNGEYAFVKIRYKAPNGDTSKLISTPVGNGDEFKDLAQAPTDARFAAAVAAFGQLLKGDTTLGGFSYEDDLALAKGARGADPSGYRAEFINLVELAKHIAGVPQERKPE